MPTEVAEKKPTVTVTGPSSMEGAARLVELLRQSTPEQKKMIRDAMGVTDPSIKRKKSRGSNADARQFVTRFGECVHGDDFEVLPPQGVYERGPQAVAAWFAKREDNQGITDAELDAIVAAAKE